MGKTMVRNQKNIYMRNKNKYDFIEWAAYVNRQPMHDWPAEKEAWALQEAWARKNLPASEVAIQSRAFLKVWNTRPDLRGRIFTINNNSENAIKGALNRAMGVLAGVSDMCLLGKLGLVIWVEWKTANGRQSQIQKEWADLCDSLGHLYIIVRNEAEFMAVVDFYL